MSRVHADLCSLTRHETAAVPEKSIMRGKPDQSGSTIVTSITAATAIQPDIVTMTGAIAKIRLTASVAEMLTMIVLKVNNHQLLVHAHNLRYHHTLLTLSLTLYTSFCPDVSGLKARQILGPGLSLADPGASGIQQAFNLEIAPD